MPDPRGATVVPIRMRARDRDSTIATLQAGAFPRRGYRHILVGRTAETAAVGKDLDRVAAGGSMVRFVIGDYGAGKSFFLGVITALATAKKLVTVRADLHADRRLASRTGQARALYRELMQHLTTPGQPDGGPLTAVVERFVTTARAEAERKGMRTDHVIEERLAEISELVGGYDFAKVVGKYWTGYSNGNDALKADAIGWMRGDFVWKAQAEAYTLEITKQS